MKQLNPDVLEYNWALIIWVGILRLGGITLPPTHIFQGEFIQQLIKKVKEQTPKKDWGSRGEDEMWFYIERETRQVIDWLSTIYINDCFPRSTKLEERISSSFGSVGQRVLFFLLVALIQKGVYPKDLIENRSLHGNFWGARHTKNIEELLSFVNEGESAKSS